MKVWKTSVLKEQWYYSEYIGESDPVPKIAAKPDEIPLEYENLYIDAYAFVLSDSRENERQVKNVTITTVDVSNLFYSDTELSISVYTDKLPVFTRVLNEVKVSKGNKVRIYADLQCYDYFIMRIETSEGFQTKQFNCEDQDPEFEVSETFVTRMSSVVKNVKIQEDYTQYA